MQNYKYKNVFTLAIFLLILSSFYISYSKIINVDEIEGLHTAWKMLNGESIYVDFFQHHHSFYYYLLMPIILIFGELAKTIIIARIVFFLFFLIIIYYTYKIARLENDQVFAKSSFIILLSFVIFSFKAIEVRPDVPQIALFMIALYYFIKSFNNKKKYTSIISAMALGLAFLILQKTILMIAVFGIIQIYYIYRKEYRIEQFFLYWGTFLIVLLPFIINILIKGQLHTYFLYNWKINLNNIYRFSPIQNLKDSYHQNTLHWVFYFITLVFIKKKISLKIISVLSIYFIVTLFIFKAPWPQYLIITAPFVSIIASYGLCTLFKNKSSIMYFLLVLLIVPFYFEFNKIKSNKYDLDRLQYVIDNTNKMDKVFDSYPYINLFREDIDYFWFSTQDSGLLKIYQKMTNYKYDIYELIEKHKPKIIGRRNVANMGHNSIKPFYFESEKYPTLYIRKNL